MFLVHSMLNHSSQSVNCDVPKIYFSHADLNDENASCIASSSCTSESLCEEENGCSIRTGSLRMNLEEFMQGAIKRFADVGK